MFSPKKLTRVGQWNGRRRSSRSEESVLPNLWRRDVTLRLAVVVVTTLAVAVLGLQVGPTYTYRVGEVCNYDLRARVPFAVVNQSLTDRQREQAGEQRPGGMVLDQYPAAALLVPRGQVITEAQALLLAEESKAYLHSRTLADSVRRGASLFLVLYLLSLVVVLYVARFQP